ncbi:MAG: MoaD/ThiS family protein [Desulfobacterales bacterium]|nr:MoaD/ThiS family protein [Desulfobacterales bacterium]
MNIKLVCGSETLLDSWPGEIPPTVEQLLNTVKKTHPQAAANWCDEKGRLRASLAVFINGEHIRYRQGLRTELKEADEVYVIALIAGG